MIPLFLALCGGAALIGALLVLRTFGPGYRVGRLLASVPRVSIGEAIRIAERGERRYVLVEGRVDADEEFEDQDHRPLVYRRTRLESHDGRRWRVFEDDRRSVAFRVQEGIDAIGVNAGDLDEGLVVIRRESTGRAADLVDRAPAGMGPETPVRVRIDQLSSVEHASVLGVPVVTDDGPAMAAGMGRPLVLTPLERREAMRVLAEGGRLRPRLAAGLLVAAALFVVAAVAVAVLAPPAALGASPSAATVGGDPRSSGEGPGLVGDPAFAIAVVLGIALVTLVATLAWIRLTSGARR